MSIENPNILSDASREAVHAARDAAQTVEFARQEQSDRSAEAAVSKVTQSIGDIMQDRIEHVLARGTEQDKSIILARVPYICQDIKEIKKGLGEIKKMIDRNRTDREADDRIRETEFDKKYVNHDQFGPFKWALVTVATVVITSLAGALLAQVLIK